jgi:hypothetical protein
MILSPKTVAAFKMLRQVNPRILVKPGNHLSSVSASGKVIAHIRVPDEFPREFALYDLSKFLAAISMHDAPDIEFGDKSLTIGSGTGATVMWYSVAPNIRGVPDEKKIRGIAPLSEFLLPGETLAAIMGAARALHLEQVRLVADGATIRAVVANVGDRGSDSYSAHVAETTAKFSLVFGVDPFGLVTGDHVVRVIGNGHVIMFAPDDSYFVVLAAEKME